MASFGSWDYDVTIVGAGGAGLAAAVTAHDAGASVLVAEAGSAVGGSTALSGGAIMAASTPVQRAAGFKFHQSAYFADGARLQVRDAASGRLVYDDSLALTSSVLRPARRVTGTRSRL